MFSIDFDELSGFVLGVGAAIGGLKVGPVLTKFIRTRNETVKEALEIFSSVKKELTDHIEFLRGENKELSTKIEGLETKFTTLQQDKARRDHAILIHEAWDTTAMTLLSQHYPEHPHPPSLIPRDEFLFSLDAIEGKME